MKLSVCLKNSSALVEQRTVLLSGKTVSYTLKRTGRRRSIGLRIDDRGLTVNTPLRASEQWLQSVLQEKANWVVTKLESWREKKPAPQLWMDGAPILYRGETFTLRVICGMGNAALLQRGEELHVQVAKADNQAAIEKIITRWYRLEALQLFTECIDYFAPLMHVHPREIKLSSARTQWGSCTARGIVRLNWQLIKMPLHLVDYVVVHELAHLREMNHSAAFWKVVETVCPNYAQHRSELRRWGLDKI